MAIAAPPRIPYLPCMLRSLLVTWVLCVGVDTLAAGAKVVNKLKPGFFLNSSACLHSPSSLFMLSFVSPPNSGDFFLAISYVLNHTPSSIAGAVWIANRPPDSLAVSSEAHLTLLTSGDLVLSDNTANPTDAFVWRSNTSGRGVVQAELLDSGNLVLLNGSSEIVWESFHYPTDTLLPGQSFTNSSSSLVSNQQSDVFAPGMFSLGFNPNGNALELNNTEWSLAYWRSQITQVTAFEFDTDGSITFYNSSSSIGDSSVSNDYGEENATIRRMTLDIDGNLRLYTWDAASNQWKAVWMALTDVCTHVRGLCGSYGVCTYDPVQPTCVCPQGFSAVGNGTDLTASECKANSVMETDCSTTNTKLMEIPHVDFPDNNLDSSFPHGLASLEECKDRCLSVCECKAAVYWQSQGLCWLKKSVENGTIQWSQYYRTFLKISSADPSVSRPTLDKAFTWSSLYLWQDQAVVNYTQKRKHFNVTVIILAVLLTIQTVGFAASIAVLILRSNLTRSRHAQLDEDLKGGCLRVFSYEELKTASKNFNHKIGAGGFGTVYKGQLQDGKAVAIKQVEGLCKQQEEQFRAEIATLGRIHHINLLPMVGFCTEGNHRLLVYEYMERGSLDRVLLQRPKSSDHPEEIPVMDWCTRFQICLGVARAMHYLHSDCSHCILHCDIKPENVLLDASFCPKVADFGLAYLYSRDHTLKMSNYRGTRGYLAPEWVSNLPITAKADVYSYGMLIMEVLSGRRNSEFSESCLMDESWFFPKWAYGRGIKEVVDTSLNRLTVDWEQAEMVLKVAFACIQAHMNARPSMGKVVKMLEGMLPVHDTPPPSLFIDEDDNMGIIPLLSEG